MDRSIYIGGASIELARVKWWAREAEEAGWRITLKWWEEVERQGATNEQLTDGARHRIALDEWDAIRRASATWILAPEARGTGAWSELAFALAHNRTTDGAGPVVISGAAHRRNIFSSLAEEHETDIAAFESLTQYFRSFR